MTTQHTPGPWEARPFLTPNEDDDPLGVYMIDKAIDLTDRYWKSMDLEAGSDEEQAYLDSIHRENAANARLIAAAPELLAALQAIKARINGAWDDPALMAFGSLSANGDADILEIATAAIAAATGEEVQG
jgi:hypothetical protein